MGSCGAVLSSSLAVWQQHRQLCRDGERAGTHLEGPTRPPRSSSPGLPVGPVPLSSCVGLGCHRCGRRRQRPWSSSSTSVSVGQSAYVDSVVVSYRIRRQGGEYSSSGPCGPLAHSPRASVTCQSCTVVVVIVASGAWSWSWSPSRWSRSKKVSTTERSEDDSPVSEAAAGLELLNKDRRIRSTTRHHVIT